MQNLGSGKSFQLRAVWKHTATAFLVVAVGVVVQAVGMSCVVNDQFRCGTPRGDDSSLARICDQKGEYCICETQRCAVHDAACERAGFSALRYSFEWDDDEDACVPKEAAKSAIMQTTGGPEFCPGNGPDLPCGLEGGRMCAANEVCVCDGNRCAGWDTNCESRYRFVVTGQCVPPERAHPETMVFASDGGLGLCPGQTQLPPPCGMQIFGQAPVRCEGSQVCICAQNLFQCAFLSPSCDTGYRWVQDGSCVVAKDLTKADIEAPEQQVNADGVCPQFAPKDAGVSDASEADGSTMNP